MYISIACTSGMRRPKPSSRSYVRLCRIKEKGLFTKFSRATDSTRSVVSINLNQKLLLCILLCTHKGENGFSCTACSNLPNHCAVHICKIHQTSQKFIILMYLCWNIQLQRQNWQTCKTYHLHRATSFSSLCKPEVPLMRRQLSLTR